MEHKHEITRNNEVVYTQGNFDHAYKEYYVKPLHRNLISLEDSFYRAPVIKTTVEKSIGRYDYRQSKYIFNTRTNMPSIKEGNTFVHEFKFKDNSFIHGRMLPVPDIKTRIRTADLLKLFHVGFKEGPNSLKVDNVTENAKLTGATKEYNLQDLYGRKLRLTYRGLTTKVTSLTVVSFDIERIPIKVPGQPDRYEPINIPVSSFMELESDDGKGSWEITMSRSMKNFMIVPTFSNKWRVKKETSSEDDRQYEDVERDSMLGSIKDILKVRMAHRKFIEGEGKYTFTNQNLVEWQTGREQISKKIDFKSMMDFIKDNIIFIASTDDALKADASGVMTYNGQSGSFLETNLVPASIVIGQDLVKFELVENGSDYDE